VAEGDSISESSFQDSYRSSLFQKRAGRKDDVCHLCCLRHEEVLDDEARKIFQGLLQSVGIGISDEWIFAGDIDGF